MVVSLSSLNNYDIHTKIKIPFKKVLLLSLILMTMARIVIVHIFLRNSCNTMGIIRDTWVTPKTYDTIGEGA